jgi:flotillin
MLHHSLFANTSPFPSSPADPFPWYLLLPVFAAIMLFSFVLLLVRRYKRCRSDQVLVIFGKVGGGNTSKCIHGGAAFVWPLIQDHAFLSLEPIQIEIPLKGALSAENIRVNVPSVFTVAIGTDLDVMNNAAIRLLRLTTEETKQQAADIIFGQLRQVIASMHIEEINKDREKFLQSIQTSLEPELKKIGLVLINVNITDITDESGYIEAIGRKAASQAVQQAKIDVSQQEKLGQIGIAEAERDKAIQVANANKLREIGTREAFREQAVRLALLEREQKVGEQTAALERDAQIKEAQRQQAVRLAELDKEQKVGEQTAAFEREAQVKEAERTMRVRLAELDKEQKIAEQTAVLAREAQIKEAQRQQAVRIAQLDKEQKIGEQTAAYERDAQVKAAEQKMRVAVADANAKAIAGENHSQAEIAVAQAGLQVKQAEAYQLGETRKREAEAAVQEAQNRALAKAALAQAERVEAERRAAVEAPAKAEKARTIVEAEAEAEKRRIEAEGQAAAIYAKLEAEARGQFEILAKKGAGLQRIIQACGGAQQAFQLLMLDHLDNLAQTAALAISSIKFDKVIVWENGGGNGNGTTNTAHFLQSLARTMPPMMQIMKDIGGIELPEYIAKLTPEARAGEKTAASPVAENGAVPTPPPRG